MEKLMNKIMKRFGAVCISIFMVFTLCMPCFADETQKTIRVGSFEDTFNYVDDHGVRRGYGYELMQALAGYTGWKFEYVKCDWSNCFDKLENGEIDIMGDIAYTDDRAKEMLFSEETMGEEKYVLYANLSDTDICLRIISLWMVSVLVCLKVLSLNICLQNGRISMVFILSM